MEPPIAIGQLLAGKYRIERVLGAGGMGMVVEATQLKLDRRVAVKFLHPEMLSHADIVERFAREARAAAKIHSEHVARVIDVGELESGAPYLVIEYLEGADFDQILQREGTLPVAVAVDVVLEACEAIAEAHVLGIVHRDIKPANLFRADRPNGTSVVKVLDFGISKERTGDNVALTRSTAAMGTPLYMSPEQLRDAGTVDARTDVWALGVVLYQLIAGEPPFAGQSVTAVSARILQDPLRPLRDLRSDVDPLLDQALAGALEKDRERRFRDVGALAAAIAPFGSERGLQSLEHILRTLMPSSEQTLPLARKPLKSEPHDPGLAATVESQPVANTASAWTEGSRPQAAGGSKRRALAALAVAAAGFAGWLAARNVSQTTTDPAAPTSAASERAGASEIAPPAAPPNSAVPSAAPSAAPSASPSPSASALAAGPSAQSAASGAPARPAPSEKIPFHMGLK